MNMIITLLGRLLLVILGSWILGQGLKRWMDLPHPDPTRVKIVGMGLIGVVGFISAHFITSPLAHNGWSVNWPGDLQILLARASLILLGVLGFLAGVRGVLYIQNTHQIPGRLVTPNLLVLCTQQGLMGEYTKEVMVFSREQLEEDLRKVARTSKLRFRWAEGCQLPFTTGFWRPSVCCPIWISQEADGTFLEVLLQHEGQHVALGHHRVQYILGLTKALMPWLGAITDPIVRAMELEADQRVIGSSTDHGALYQQALRSVVGQAHGDVLVGIGHDPRNVERRIQQMAGIPGQGWGYAVGLGGMASLIILGSLWFGRPRLDNLLQISLRPQGGNIRVLVGDPKGSVYSFLGGDGVATDGVGVNAQNISGAYILVDLAEQKKEPFEGEVQIGFDFWAKGPKAPKSLKPIVLTRAVKSGRSQVGKSNIWAMNNRTLETNVVELALGSGDRNFSLHGEQSDDSYEVIGPQLLVPKGWQVEIKHVQFRTVPWSASPLEQARRVQNLARFEGRLRQLEELNNPPRINLAWDAAHSIVGY